MRGGGGKRRHQEERSKFTALENHFLNTFFSGLYISAAELIAIGSETGISLDMNTREKLIKELLNRSDSAGTLSEVIERLNALIDARIQTYRRLCADYPGTCEPLTRLAQKANGTKNLLAREHRGSPYEQ